ncbi:MAG TPA: hypothetical protein VH302_10160 [Bryobacteraceae bacterium]|nr:hypothetical protein [Bryobacteraceae bacterium]
MFSYIWQYVLIGCLMVAPCAAQFTTTLQPRSVEEFDAYARRVENGLEQRWTRKLPFLSLDEHPNARAAVLGGDLWIEPGGAENPISIHDGLVHDWTGAVFIPSVDIAKVVAIMQGFDRHSQIYPEVTRSRLINKKDGDIKGYWRLVRTKAGITVVLDVTQDAYWREVAAGKWICRAYSKNISEVQDAGTPAERVLPPGQGTGYMWRLYAYWSLERVEGGVLAEGRTVSLSRDIPGMLSWAIKPFVQSVPRESLAGMLQHTRDAALKQRSGAG